MEYIIYIYLKCVHNKILLPKHYIIECGIRYRYIPHSSLTFTSEYTEIHLTQMFNAYNNLTSNCNLFELLFNDYMFNCQIKQTLLLIG